MNYTVDDGLWNVMIVYISCLVWNPINAIYVWFKIILLIFFLFSSIINIDLLIFHLQKKKKKKKNNNNNNNNNNRYNSKINK